MVIAVTRSTAVSAKVRICGRQELDQAWDLDDADPVELGIQYRALRERHPSINVLGGCCGTDHRHIEQICLACTAVPAAA